ncbi:sirohydrochlorin cobaltochelatase [Clostridium taeniosporum]|uniref:Cobalt chelatase n=1 Tax=Clostridium taeniosporum TaxID=394958 RepID=A0A1D7XLM6_9CLOT|nr:sirohydrochlorin cobaltochelatase [Clostridium taeniosporum]AOR24242.1 cobalt chelatase [Clostridium taeniosporum]
MKNNRAIILVGFGTANIVAIKKCIDPIENEIREVFGEEFLVFKCFTSKIILRKLSNDFGVNILHFEEALRCAKLKGCTEILIMPLNVLHGNEYEKIKEFALKYNHEFSRILLGKPILQLDIETKEIVSSNIIEGIKKELPKDKNLLLVGHGTTNKSDIVYSLFEKELSKMNYENIIIGTLEGKISINEIIDKIIIREIKEITIVPFLSMAGKHINRDIFGENEYSWKRIIEARGVKVKCFRKSLTEFLSIKKLYLDNIKELVDEL